MRRIPAAFAALSLTVLGLAGCAGTPTASCERATSDTSTFDLIDVTGDPGAAQATVDSPVEARKTIFEDLDVGHGQRVVTRGQDVRFTATILDAESGKTILPAQKTSVTTVAQWAQYYPGFATMLDCATEGSRIVGVVPTDDLSKEAAANLRLDGTDAIVVLDLDKVYLPAADGDPQYNDRHGIPSVVLAPDGRPGIIVPDSAPPSDVAIEVLKRGHGEKVTAAATPRLHYTGVLWDKRTVFDSTWQDGAPLAVDLSTQPAGFAKAVRGQRVGSQILVVVPPAAAGDDTPQGSGPAESARVYVIDILGVDEPAADPAAP